MDDNDADDLRSKEKPEYLKIQTVKVITRTTEAIDQDLAITSCVDLITSRANQN